jgi:hypothetical protein
LIVIFFLGSCELFTLQPADRIGNQKTKKTTAGYHSSNESRSFLLGNSIGPVVVCSRAIASNPDLQKSIKKQIRSL